MRDWPLTKIVDVSEHIGCSSYKPGEIIYDMGDNSDYVFFVKEGEVSLELYY